jgi:hypothetical protein
METEVKNDFFLQITEIFDAHSKGRITKQKAIQLMYQMVDAFSDYKKAKYIESVQPELNEMELSQNASLLAMQGLVTNGRLKVSLGESAFGELVGTSIAIGKAMGKRLAQRKILSDDLKKFNTRIEQTGNEPKAKSRVITLGGK